jgi:hypothetical protein
MELLLSSLEVIKTNHFHLFLSFLSKSFHNHLISMLVFSFKLLTFEYFPVSIKLGIELLVPLFHVYIGDDNLVLDKIFVMGP